MKSYVLMAQSDNRPDTFVRVVASREIGLGGLDYCRSLANCQWAVLYEFDGDDVQTTDHYERRA